MPNRAKIKVTAPAQGDIEVTVYRPGGSVEAAAFTTETGSTAVTFPLAISAGASDTVWVQEGPHVVSVKAGDVEFAAGYGQTWAGEVNNDGVHLRPEATVGVFGGAGSGGTYPVVFSATGEVVVSTGGHRFYVEEATTIQSVRASVGTAPTGASLIVDVNKNGTTIFTTQSNRPTIAASGFTDVSGTPEVTALDAGDYLTVDIDQVGSSVPGANLTVTIVLS